MLSAVCKVQSIDLNRDLRVNQELQDSSLTMCTFVARQIIQGNLSGFETLETLMLLNMIWFSTYCWRFILNTGI